VKYAKLARGWWHAGGDFLVHCQRWRERIHRSRGDGVLHMSYVWVGMKRKVAVSTVAFGNSRRAGHRRWHSDSVASTVAHSCFLS
jgi:hypothetical protein